MGILFILLSVIIIVAIIRRGQRHLKSEMESSRITQEEILRRRLKAQREDEIFNKQLSKLQEEFQNGLDKDKMKSFYDKLQMFTNPTDYPRESMFKKIQNEYGPLSKKYIRFKQCFKDETVIKFLQSYEEFVVNKSIDFYQNNFVTKEIILNRRILDNIDRKSLDHQQRIAVVTDEENNLIIAGAGSGKTLTISAKVKYLSKVKYVDPEDILLITFTKKAAIEMEDRIVNKLGINVKVKTFHALGYDILGAFKNEKPEVFDDVSKMTLKFIKEYIPNNEQLQENIFKYFSLYMNDYISYEQFESLGDYYKANKSHSFEPIKSKINTSIEIKTMIEKQKALNQNIISLQKMKKTIQGEKVKSLEELIIANFLFTQGIKYVYEQPYIHKTSSAQYKQYRPDFYLPDYDIYLEHFGINELGRTPQYTAIEEQKYIDGIKWKRELHKKNNTKLVETYSWEHKRGLLINKLNKIIKDNKIRTKPLSKEELIKYLQILNTDYEFQEFYKLLNTFLNLFKSNNFSESDLAQMRQQAEELKSVYTKEKHLLFFEIFQEFYTFYQKELSDNKMIDFNDMINQATKILRKTKIPKQFQYKYIIIDEFQDISVARYKLIKVIKNKCNSTIMAVGDDWQSIYRFAGSDISIFTKFSDYFGNTKILKIENTYRNSQQLINIAGKFVMENTEQIKKDLKSSQSLTTPIIIVTYQNAEKDKLDETDNSFIHKLLSILKILNNTNDKKNILLLGRNNFDIQILSESKYFQLEEEEGIVKVFCHLYKKLDITFMTVHKSKGLEADEVIVINNRNNITGFPNKIVGDSVLDYVINTAEEYLYAEERRLFYVALTRTRNHCYLLAPEDSSIFIEELKKNKMVEELKLNNNAKMLCPKCKTGHLINRKSKNNKKFLGCSNYPQCDYVLFEDLTLKEKVLCPTCGAYMTLRKGKYGEFYGCSNYPYCTTTLNV